MSPKRITQCVSWVTTGCIFVCMHAYTHAHLCFKNNMMKNNNMNAIQLQLMHNKKHKKRHTHIYEQRMAHIKRVFSREDFAFSIQFWLVTSVFERGEVHVFSFWKAVELRNFFRGGLSRDWANTEDGAGLWIWATANTVTTKGEILSHMIILGNSLSPLMHSFPFHIHIEGGGEGLCKHSLPTQKLHTYFHKHAQ